VIALGADIHEYVSNAEARTRELHGTQLKPCSHRLPAAATGIRRVVSNSPIAIHDSSLLIVKPAQAASVVNQFIPTGHTTGERESFLNRDDFRATCRSETASVRLS
jgi:hypothetical protein